MSLSKERAEQLISVLRGLVEGKTIQANLMGRWVDRLNMQDQTLFHPGVDYRVKPEPKKTYYRLWEAAETGGVRCFTAYEIPDYVTTGQAEARMGKIYGSTFKRWIGDWQEHIVQED